MTNRGLCHSRLRTRLGLILALLLGLGALPALATAASATAAFPHRVVGGFATPAGSGFWLFYQDGAVSTYGAAHSYGSRLGHPLSAPLVAASSSPSGRGYWLVSGDGGVFSFGDAHFYGGLGTRHLAQPVVAFIPSHSGHGYWLVTRDGGVFSFGDARFYGSVGGRHLAHPIVAAASSASGRGYRLVAGDGGVFSFGDAYYAGSLPSRKVHTLDVLGMGVLPDGLGYWLMGVHGHTYAFGRAPSLGNYTPGTCDVVVGAFSNPHAVGYRLVTASGATAAYGHAPAGIAPTGAEGWCYTQTNCVPHLGSAASYQRLFNTRGPVWDSADGGASVMLPDGRRLWLMGDTLSGPTSATQILPGWGFVRNSIIIEQGNCFTFRLGGAGHGRFSYMAPSNGVGWFWPTAGVVDTARNVVDVTVAHLGPAPKGTPSGWDWTTLHPMLVTLDLHSLAVLSERPLQPHSTILWGTGLLQSGQWLYVYGSNPDAASADHYVARTTVTQFASGSWSYWTGATWSSQPSSARPVLFRTPTGAPAPVPSTGLTVDPYGAGFLASGKQCDVLCNDVSAWYASSPTGPFIQVNNNGGRVDTTSRVGGKFSYSGRLFHTSSGWLALWMLGGGGGCHPGCQKYTSGPQVDIPSNLPVPAVAAKL